MSDDRTTPTDFLKKSREKKAKLAGLRPGVPESYVEISTRALEMAEKGALTSDDVLSLAEQLGYEFRYNTVQIRLECRVATDKPMRWREMSDGLYACVQQELRVLGEYAGRKVAKVLCKPTIVDSIIKTVSEKSRVNPIVDFLTLASAKASSGEAQAGAFDILASHFKDEDGKFPVFLKKWMLGCVARTFLGFQNYTLVLEGGQGLGKSHFGKWLASGLPDEYFQEGVILPGNKDHILRLAKKWIWIVDEFGETFSRSSQNALKAFLTSDVISERPPYGHHDITLRRQCNIIATTNDNQFLCDKTGNRRYLTVHLTDIDHGYSQKLTPEDVWADMSEEFYQDSPDQPWLLGEQDIIYQKSANEKSEIGDVLQDFLEETFRSTKDEKSFMRVKHVHNLIFEHFEAKKREEQNKLRIAAIQIFEHKMKIKQEKMKPGIFYNCIENKH